MANKKRAVDALIILPSSITRNLRASGVAPGSTSPLQIRDDLIVTSRKRRSEQVRSSENEYVVRYRRSEFKLLQVQEKFPHDNLRLTESPDSPSERVKALTSRRRSAPNAVINKILNKSSSNLSIDENQRGNSPSPSSSPIHMEPKQRTYIQEGSVQLSSDYLMDLASAMRIPPIVEKRMTIRVKHWATRRPLRSCIQLLRMLVATGAAARKGVSSQTRYFFLFNDVLLVAKSKSVGTYKLKNRIRVSEMWLGTCIDEVTESTVSAEKSFVIGWPTTNYVATFSATEEKELWWASMRKCIQEQRDLEEKKDITLKICKRDMEDASVITKSLSVSIYEDANSVTKMALENFHLPEENPEDYQLWVISGKENVAYPLIGHEVPYAIKVNHVREAFMDSSERHTNNNIEGGPLLEALSPEVKCEFILKKARKSGDRFNLDIPGAQKRWRNPMKKSPIINWAMNKKGGKGNVSQEIISPGKLFGLSLTALTTNEELVPKPIEDILLQLFRKGPSTVGIFRKSGLMKSMKQVRQALNEGAAVELEDKPAVLLSTILKEFFRSLPDCIFGSDFYDEFVASKEISDATARAEEIKKILNKLPKPNQELIKRFLCLAFYIAKYSERNSMTASNLAVCIAPSLIWPPGQEKLMSPETTTNAAEFVCFVIENFVGIYGEEALGLLGRESEICLDAAPVPEEDPETVGDPIIFHCVQGDTDTERSMRPADLRTSFSFGGPKEENEDGSEERLNLSNSLNLTSGNLFPGKVRDSKSSPSSPLPSRRRSPPTAKQRLDDLKRLENGFIDNRVTIRRYSDQDIKESEARDLPKYTRVKRTLISTTTSAELIEHKRPSLNGFTPRMGQRDHNNGNSSPQTVRVMSPSNTSPRGQSRRANHSNGSIGIQAQQHGHSDYVDSAFESPDISITPNASPRGFSGGSNQGSETSSSDGGRCSPHRSPLSSPMLRKKFQFSEGRPTQADIVMQNFYRRQQPAAPSYDEHIQRRQLWHRQGASQRLGSDSDNERAASGRADDVHDAGSVSRKLDKGLHVSELDDTKTTRQVRSKDVADVQPSAFTFGRPCFADREMVRSQPNMEHKSYLNVEKDTSPLYKHSPRLVHRRLDIDTKNFSESSIYSRVSGEHFRTPGYSPGRTFFGSQVDSQPKNEPSHASGNSGLYVGIPVKSNYSHFPATDFFPPEAKVNFKSSGGFNQNPWAKEEARKHARKDMDDALDSRSQAGSGNTSTQIDELGSIRRDVTTSDLPTLDVSVPVIPHLSDLETPTLEDFQNFMFQDESRV